MDVDLMDVDLMDVDLMDVDLMLSRSDSFARLMYILSASSGASVPFSMSPLTLIYTSMLWRLRASLSSRPLRQWVYLLLRSTYHKQRVQRDPPAATTMTPIAALLDSMPASTSTSVGSAGGAGLPGWTFALGAVPGPTGNEAGSSGPAASSRRRRGRLALLVDVSAGAGAGMHSLHPLLCTLKSDDHNMLPVGATPSGPARPEYRTPSTTR